MLVLDVILGLVVLVFLIYRQLSARQVNASALRLLVILVIIGVLQTYQFLSKNHAHPLTIAAIVGSVVLAAVFGWLRANTVRVWLDDDGQAWSKGNWLTAHLVYDLLVAHGPDTRGLGTATIILYLAVSLGFQRLLVLQRARRLQPTGPGQPGGG